MFNKIGILRGSVRVLELWPFAAMTPFRLKQNITGPGTSHLNQRSIPSRRKIKASCSVRTYQKQKNIMGAGVST